MCEALPAGGSYCVEFAVRLSLPLLHLSLWLVDKLRSRRVALLRSFFAWATTAAFSWQPNIIQQLAFNRVRSYIALKWKSFRIFFKHFSKFLPTEVTSSSMMLSPFSRFGGDIDSWNPSLGHLSTWDPMDEFFSGVGSLGVGLPSNQLSQLSTIRPRIVQEGDHQKCLVNLRMGSDFAPEDLKIRVNKGVVCVDAKKRQQSQDGNHQVYQEVCRKFTLPEGVNPREVKSHLDHNGVLRIEAPISQNALQAPPEPRRVAIEHDEI